MLLFKPKNLFLITLFFYLFIFNSIFSQDKILSVFESYSELPREVAFVHLNKSIYIKGENIGYKAYVLDKANRKPSLETTNLYCVILDSTNTVIKQQLVKVENGMASGLFQLDSLFTSGDYKFSAFTNWMRNFSEQNHFSQSIKIIDPEKTKEVNSRNINLNVDAQFLPEGGHAVVGIETVYGVVIKNNFGFGIPNIEGDIVDSKNNRVTNFKLNDLGISRFILRPKLNEQYTAVFQINNKEHRFPLTGIKPFGYGIKIQNLNSKLGVLVSSSKKNSKKNYLTIHSGDSIKSLDIDFNKSTSVLKVIPIDDLYPSMNIFTLFNDEGKPILERLFFNYDGLRVVNLETPKLNKGTDSLEVSLSLKEKSKNLLGSLSLSILPAETKSYNAHHNLISSVHLTPYLNGPTEKANYYFKNITPRKKYDLDNLLLTQGWSSYDWNFMQSQKPDYLFDFEKGITYKTSINGDAAPVYFQYPTLFHGSETFTIEDNESSFTKNFFFPFDKEKLSLSQINKNGELKKPGVFVQFKPSVIPKVNFRNHILQNQQNVIFNSETIPPLSFESISKLQELDEVVLLKRKTADRIERIKNRSFGNVDFFGIDDHRRNQYLSAYLNQRGFTVIEEAGQVSIANRNPNSPNNATPIIYLDDAILIDFSNLYQFRLDIVDYIEINKSGVGGGIRGGGGIIKIYTDPFKRTNKSKVAISASYDIPLSFTQNKRYYTPLYNSYASDFFKNYGAIDWYPDLTVNGAEISKFKVINTGLSKVKLFVEGILNDGSFISDAIEVEIK